MDDIKSVVAKNIADLRLSNGLTQIDLAEKLSYSDKAVSKWERGESLPDVSVLLNIADIFGVTLDYLVHSDHSEKNPSPKSEISEKRKNSRVLITEISMLFVWFLATAVFVIFGIIPRNISFHWLAFVYAVPVCMIVWLVFNSIWFDAHRNYFIISILIWSMLCAVYLTVYACGYDIWIIFLLGIPSQLIIIMCSKFSKKPSMTSEIVKKIKSRKA